MATIEEIFASVDIDAILAELPPWEELLADVEAMLDDVPSIDELLKSYPDNLLDDLLAELPATSATPG